MNFYVNRDIRWGIQQAETEGSISFFSSENKTDRSTSELEAKRRRLNDSATSSSSGVVVDGKGELRKVSLGSAGGDPFPSLRADSKIQRKGEMMCKEGKNVSKAKDASGKCAKSVLAAPNSNPTSTDPTPNGPETVVTAAAAAATVGRVSPNSDSSRTDRTGATADNRRMIATIQQHPIESGGRCLVRPNACLPEKTTKDKNVLATTTTTTISGSKEANSQSFPQPLKAQTMAHLRTKYMSELQFMRREFRKLERQLLGVRGAAPTREKSAGSRERREKLHSFILHLEDTIGQIELGCRLEAEGKSTAIIQLDRTLDKSKTTSLPTEPKNNDSADQKKHIAVSSSTPTNPKTREKEEQENAQKLEEHILANLLPVKIRLTKQLAAQQGASRNPAGMPLTRGGRSIQGAPRGKGTFAAAADRKKVQNDNVLIHPQTHDQSNHQIPQTASEPLDTNETTNSSQFGKPLHGGGSSLTQKLHGPTLGSTDRPHGDGVGSSQLEDDAAQNPVPDEVETPSKKRKVLYAGMAIGSTQVKSGVSAAAGVHDMVIENIENTSAPPSPTSSPVATPSDPDSILIAPPPLPCIAELSPKDKTQSAKDIIASEPTPSVLTSTLLMEQGKPKAPAATNNTSNFHAQKTAPITVASEPTAPPLPSLPHHAGQAVDKPPQIPVVIDQPPSAVTTTDKELKESPENQNLTEAERQRLLQRQERKKRRRVRRERRRLVRERQAQKQHQRQLLIAQHQRQHQAAQAAAAAVVTAATTSSAAPRRGGGSSGGGVNASKAPAGTIAAKNKGPRSVEYVCALCNETYASTCDVNPWWALTSHDCPKCSKTQIPRIDISVSANAIEYHPALLAHAEDSTSSNSGGASAASSGATGGGNSMQINPSHVAVSPAFLQTPSMGVPVGDFSKYPSDSEASSSFRSNENGESSDETLSDDSDEDQLSPAEKAENERFGKNYKGPTFNSWDASRLLILLSHASTCPGRHKDPRQREVCRSAKYLMLHVRDCSGTTSGFDVCPFPWCRKVKHLLYHLVSCVDPTNCEICTPKGLPDHLSTLAGLNRFRQSNQKQSSAVEDTTGKDPAGSQVPKAPKQESTDIRCSPPTHVEKQSNEQPTHNVKTEETVNAQRKRGPDQKHFPSNNHHPPKKCFRQPSTDGRLPATVVSKSSVATVAVQKSRVTKAPQTAFTVAQASSTPMNGSTILQTCGRVPLTSTETKKAPILVHNKTKQQGRVLNVTTNSEKATNQISNASQTQAQTVVIKKTPPTQPPTAPPQTKSLTGISGVSDRQNVVQEKTNRSKDEAGNSNPTCVYPNTNDESPSKVQEDSHMANSLPGISPKQEHSNEKQRSHVPVLRAPEGPLLDQALNRSSKGAGQSVHLEKQSLSKQPQSLHCGLSSPSGLTREHILSNDHQDDNDIDSRIESQNADFAQSCDTSTPWFKYQVDMASVLGPMPSKKSNGSSFTLGENGSNQPELSETKNRLDVDVCAGAEGKLDPVTRHPGSELIKAGGGEVMQQRPKKNGVQRGKIRDGFGSAERWQDTTKMEHVVGNISTNSIPAQLKKSSSCSGEVMNASKSLRLRC